MRRKPGGGIELADPIDTMALPCYDAKGLTRMLPHLTAGVEAHERARLDELRQRP